MDLFLIEYDSCNRVKYPKVTERRRRRFFSPRTLRRIDLSPALGHTATLLSSRSGMRPARWRPLILHYWRACRLNGTAYWSFVSPSNDPRQNASAGRVFRTKIKNSATWGTAYADKNADLISIGETEISSWRASALHEEAGKLNKTRNLYSQLERYLSFPFWHRPSHLSRPLVSKCQRLHVCGEQ